jgi:hypothetical protein
MSFVLWTALAIAGLVAGPIVAHLLRRGRAREHEFPATALVPSVRTTARERQRIEDWLLLVLRPINPLTQLAPTQFRAPSGCFH